MTTGSFRFFLGGRDLEMETIAALLAEHAPGRAVDRRLAWGARASAYRDEIAATLAAGETPILIELEDDMPIETDRTGLVFVDHHGARAGEERPTSLEQVFDLLNLDRDRHWSRWHDLVAANDRGHVRALRALGADAAEIRRVRDADRRAQGVTSAEEVEAERAIAAREARGRLTIVTAESTTSSAIGDFMEPEYGGPGGENLLVLLPESASFFGDGAVVQALAAKSGSWSGGDLPRRGFWGLRVSRAAQPALVEEVAALVS